MGGVGWDIAPDGLWPRGRRRLVSGGGMGWGIAPGGLWPRGRGRLVSGGRGVGHSPRWAVA